LRQELEQERERGREQGKKKLRVTIGFREKEKKRRSACTAGFSLDCVFSSFV
jgi:hypothetical protein